eukprot:167235_1
MAAVRSWRNVTQKRCFYSFYNRTYSLSANVSITDRINEFIDDVPGRQALIPLIQGDIDEKKYALTSQLYPVITKDKIAQSKFGGIPYLQTDELWPKCGICSKEMSLFIQINFNEIPAMFLIRNFPSTIWESKNILQLFYCTDTICDTKLCCGENAKERFSPYGKAHLCRIVKYDTINQNEIVKYENIETLTKPSEKLIVKWELLGAPEYGCYFDDDMVEYY